MKYRKKPIIIEAIQFNEESKGEIDDWLAGTHHEVALDGRGDLILMIETLEGTMVANPGDFIIKGVEGEFYPCKPCIFVKTYDPEEE